MSRPLKIAPKVALPVESPAALLAKRREPTSLAKKTRTSTSGLRS